MGHGERVLNMVVAGLRHRIGRATALFVGVLVAATGFTVLTGATETSRLRVAGEVAAHASGAYEILVRPKGARTELEQQRGLVRPNFLAGQYGGISVAQWRAVQAMAGVDVAAPIAMLGYASTWTRVTLDITDAVDRSKAQQLIEVRPVWTADRGLSGAVDRSAGLVYVTTNPLAFPTDVPAMVDDTTEIDYSDGLRRPAMYECYDHWFMTGLPYERLGNGTTAAVCPAVVYDSHEQRRAASDAAQLNPDGTFTVGGTVADRLLARVLVPMPLLVAAIDPTAEAALVGLDRAVVDGRYLAPHEPAVELSSDGIGDQPSPPALLVNRPAFDEELRVRTRQLDLTQLESGPATVAGRTGEQIRVLEGLPAVPGTEGTSSARTVVDGYQPTLRGGADAELGFLVNTSVLRQIGPVQYDVDAGGRLVPRSGAPAAAGWRQETQFEAPPLLADDTGFRALVARAGTAVLGPLGVPVVVGVFDPARLSDVDDINGARRWRRTPRSRPPAPTTPAATCSAASHCVPIPIPAATWPPHPRSC
jgi:hypothetical protein